MTKSKDNKNYLEVKNYIHKNETFPPVTLVTGGNVSYPKRIQQPKRIKVA